MLLVQGGVKHTGKSGQPQTVFFCPPKPQHIPRVLLPGMLLKTQAEPGRRRGTLGCITLLFRERCCSAASDPSLPYLLSAAALNQLLWIDLTPSQHFPSHLSPCKASAGTLSLGSTQQAGRGVWVRCCSPSLAETVTVSFSFI